MAVETPKRLRKSLIYSIFVRNFSEEGTFEQVASQLDRIKALGTDYIWFLPFYPIGEINRKGTVGSPYAIKDYRAIDPSHGTMEDFIDLVHQIHQKGMKVMIDIVYNHTSPDSVLSKQYPEWFYHKEDGSFGNRVGDWTDIIDLNYEVRDLWDYQIETLKFWAQYVDGFRCDVAPLVPLEFWLAAREEVAKVNPDCLWLSESVHPDFITFLRSKGMVALSDSEIFQAFDMSYEYDVRQEFDDYLAGKIKLSEYAKALNQQEAIYPDNYIKLRNLENHDNDRIRSLVNTDRDLDQWLVLSFFLKGATMIYNGQEIMADHKPNIFEKDPIEWDGAKDISARIARLDSLSKDLYHDNQTMKLFAQDDLDSLLMTLDTPKSSYLLAVNLKEKTGKISLGLADGHYTNLLNGEEIPVEQGFIDLIHTPLLIQK